MRWTVWLGLVVLAGCASAREWRDERGRVVIRADGDGRQLYFTWDDEDRLIRVDGPDWSHRFSYGSNGALLAEIDCAGGWHVFHDNRPIDRARGTALAEHMHVRAVERPALDSAAPLPAVEYNAPTYVGRTGKP